MGAYNYKWVRARVPQFIIDQQGDEYEGSVDYDGDLWRAAADYIDILEAEIAAQYAMTKTIVCGPLYDWLRTRKETNYSYGPAID